MGIKKINSKEARDLRGSTNWKELEKLTDEEIKTAARLDLDAQEIGPIELKRFKRERKNNSIAISFSEQRSSADREDHAPAETGR